MLTLKIVEGQCYCGCGTATAPRAHFRIGHDSKLKSALLQAGRIGEPVTLATHDGPTETDAQGAADHLMSPAGAETVRRGLLRETRPGPAKPTRGTVRVGRWDYPATRDADGTVLRAETRDGKPTRPAAAKVAATFRAS